MLSPVRPVKSAIFISSIIFLIWLLRGRDEYSDDEIAFAGSASNKPTTPRIAIVTFITSQKSYMYLSLKNKSHYARKHGYDLIVDYESKAKRGTTWLKFDMIQRLIEQGQHDWIWWMDFDTLITDTGVRLEDVIENSLANATEPENVDLLLTNDCNGLNDGSFIVRSSRHTNEFLGAVSALHDNSIQEGKRKLNDQEAMRDYLKTGVPLTKHALIVPQATINAVPEEIGCYDKERRKWEHGDFVIHFPGAWAHVKEDDPTGVLMKKYESHINWN